MHDLSNVLSLQGIAIQSQTVSAVHPIDLRRKKLFFKAFSSRPEQYSFRFFESSECFSKHSHIRL